MREWESGLNTPPIQSLFAHSSDRTNLDKEDKTQENGNKNTQEGNSRYLISSVKETLFKKSIHTGILNFSAIFDKDKCRHIKNIVYELQII